MAMNWRRGSIFVTGLLLGLTGAVAWMDWHGGGDGKPDKPTVQARRAAPAPGVPDPAAAQAAASAPQTHVAGAGPAPQVAGVDCSALAPVVQAAGADDGKVSLQQDAGKSAAMAISQMVAGKEAAAAGRPRDAEAAFLTACRIAQDVQPADPVLIADTQYQLGRHYASLAQPGARARAELLDRATSLYTVALQTYRLRYGDNHEKTRYAASGLDAVARAGGKDRLAKNAETMSAPPAQATAQAAPAPSTIPAPAADAKARQQQADRQAKAEAQARAAAQARADAQAKAQQQAQQQALAKAQQQAQAEAQARVQQQARAAAEAQREAQATQARVQQQARAAAEAQARADQQARARAEAQARAQEQAAARAAAQGAPEAPPPPPAPAATARARPSFDCAKARSPAERTICANPDLAQADRELGRLHARAKANAPDPRAFQRRSDAIWAEREANCTDAACLRQWYARRRAQLQEQAEADTPSPRATEEARVVRPRPAARPAPTVRDDDDSTEVEVQRPAAASGSPYGTPSE